jgi:cytoplasmic iron level regulating protein YaaA (DUF328/UPF0246 family)
MLFLISPAKSLNYDIKKTVNNASCPFFLKNSQSLIDELKKLSNQEISILMKISDNLANLNFERFQQFTTPFTIKNSKPALFVFNGDVYNQIDVENYNDSELSFSQENLRILSGLYGVLKPLDLMQAYRLEMSTSLSNARGKNLYDFWSEELTNYFNDELRSKNEEFIINLASNEYSKVINEGNLKGSLINIIFKTKKNGVYKNIGILAKRARGMMANFIIKNKIRKLEDLKKFTQDDYKFNKTDSDNLNYYFYN